MMIGNLNNSKLDDVKTIITHGQCPDGRASAMILHDVFPKAEVRFLMHNTDEYKNLHPMPGMIFCDIAPFPPALLQFLEAGTIVLDHHKQSLPVCLPFCERGLGLFADEKEDVGVSGALLAYEVWKKRTPMINVSSDGLIYDFAKLAGIRDTWQKNDSRWEEACWQKEALMFMSEQELLDEGVFDFINNDETHILGRRLFERHMRSVTHAADVSSRMVVGKVSVQVLNASGPIVSDASDILFNDANDDALHLDFVAGFSFVYEDGHLKVIWSLRSREHRGNPPFDVGAFAKRLGGGGHSQAAGFAHILPSGVVLGCNPYEMLAAELRQYQVLG